jgi:hypothetical protein
MARSKRTQAKATPATPETTSACRTQTPQPTSEDPPDQDSRRPRTSASAKNSQNNQPTQQNDDDAEDEESDDEPWMTDVRAAVLQVANVADAEAEIEYLRETIQKYSRKTPKTNHDKISLATARYETEKLEQRVEELKAALPTSSAADKNPSHTGKGKRRGKAVQSSAPRSRWSVLSAPVAGSGDQESSEDDTQQPPLGRSPRNRSGHRDGQASQSAADNQDPAGPDSDANLPSQQTWSPHRPWVPWKIRGITRESKYHYKICWRGMTEDGEEAWDDRWEPKDHANKLAKNDWNRRKHDPRLWKEFEPTTGEEVSQ